jgi:hypothetical protein
MSDTPRTDAFCESTQKDHVKAKFDDLEHYMDFTGKLAEFSRGMERECEALRVEYESRAHWIANMNKILGYDNTDGFHSVPDPETIARNLIRENQRLREESQWPDIGDGPLNPQTPDSGKLLQVRVTQMESALREFVRVEESFGHAGQHTDQPECADCKRVRLAKAALGD